MSHQTNIVYTNDGRFYCRCSCRAHSPWYGQRYEAEDWEYRHVGAVEQARAHLNRRSPSVRDQYDYYREREADPDTPDHDRALWKMLADGLAHRVGAPAQSDTLL
jgi:hypothetical protein